MGVGASLQTGLLSQPVTQGLRAVTTKVGDLARSANGRFADKRADQLPVPWHPHSMD